jgi:aldose 1-epimerase
MSLFKSLFTYLLLIIGAIIIFNCSKTKKTEEQNMEQPAKEDAKLSVSKTSFGKLNDSTEVYLFSLKNKNQMEVRIINYGGIITHIFAPDKNGAIGDVVLGFDSLSGYLKEPVHPYFGVLVGRYGNRIAKGKFTLDGKQYTLAVNNGENHLHGGLKGFDKVYWNAEEIEDMGKVGVKLQYTSKDMEEGYPGNLDVTVTYTLNNDNELKIDYQAKTDKKTVLNLTNHSYFNLGAGNTKDILSHIVTINADKYTPVDKGLIPTGEIVEVKGTAFDFTTSHEVGERIGQVEGGYDHNYVLNNTAGKAATAAKVFEPSTGRVLEVTTDQPGIQFYTGNFLDGSIKGKGNVPYVKNYGLCLETQHFPDSPNQPNFPSTVLSPGEKFTSTTTYKFSINKEVK